MQRDLLENWWIDLDVFPEAAEPIEDDTGWSADVIDLGSWRRPERPST